MAASGPDLVRRYTKAKNDRPDALYEEMAPFIAPARVGITSKATAHDKQTRNVYDSTAMSAAELMAHFIAGHVINPAQQWLSYQMLDARVRKIDSVREWNEECRDRSLRRLAASPFYAEGSESLVDWGGFGTGCTIIEEAPQPTHTTIQGFRGFYVRAVKTGRFVALEGPSGLVDTLFEEWSMSARVIAARWPKSLPESIRTAMTNGQQDKPFTILHAIVPRDKGERGKGAGALAMPWASVWIEMESKEVCHESGYTVFPAAVPRHQKTPGDVYGRGRGHLAFPDTWTLNTAKRMGLEDHALKIRPPVMVRHDSVIGTLRLVPGGPTSINTHGKSIADTIQPWQTGSRPETSSIKEEELRRTIREIFYVDILRQLLETHKSEMSAYEFRAKMGLLFTILGPVYARLDWEWLNQIANITFALQLEARDFSPAPPEVYQTDGEIQAIFENPIARAQRSGDIEAITLAMSDISPLTGAYPQMLDRLDPDKTADLILTLRGVPASVLRNDSEVQALRDARQQENEQEAALATAAQAAESAGKAAPFIKVLGEKAGAMTGAAA